MGTGKIKFFNRKKGFGFIIEDQTLQEIFVHATGLVDRVENEMRVTFELSEDAKGRKAINVRKSEE